MNPEFSIVIPTTGVVHLLNRCLKSLLNLSEIERTQIIIVINPERFLNPIKRMVSEKNYALNIQFRTSPLGVNCARNIGLFYSETPYIFFLDDDCVVSNPNWLIEGKRALKENPNIHAVGGHYNLGSKPSQVDQAYNQLQRDWLESNVNTESLEIPFLLGGNFAIRSDLKKFSFDESIVYGGAETEYFLRLGSLGYRFKLVPQMSIEHSSNLTFGQFYSKAKKQSRTARKLAKIYSFKQTWINKSKSFNSNQLVRFYKHRFIDRPDQPYISPNLNFRSILKNFHQKICFYLENRNLF